MDNSVLRGYHSKKIEYRVVSEYFSVCASFVLDLNARCLLEISRMIPGLGPTLIVSTLTSNISRLISTHNDRTFSVLIMPRQIATSNLRYFILINVNNHNIIQIHNNGNLGLTVFYKIFFTFSLNVGEYSEKHRQSHKTMLWI